MRDRVIVALESQDALGRDVLRREIGWRERFALENRKINLDLIEPTGVHG